MRKLKKLSEKDKIDNTYLLLYSTGLIAISLLILQDFISTGVSDIAIFIALIAFSLALPLLVGAVILYRVQVEYGYYSYSVPYVIAVLTFALGSVCALIGIDATFWHISWIAGIVFVVVTIVAFLIFGSAMPPYEEVERLKREEAEREKALE